MLWQQGQSKDWAQLVCIVYARGNLTTWQSLALQVIKFLVCLDISVKYVAKFCFLGGLFMPCPKVLLSKNMWIVWTLNHQNPKSMYPTNLVEEAQ
jgi:hypothetical protein